MQMQIKRSIVNNYKKWGKLRCGNGIMMPIKKDLE